MWIVAKYDRNKLNFFLSNLKKELNGDLKIYNPVLRIKNFYKKTKEKKIYVLEDYIFCFSEKFLLKSTIVNLKFTKGLKYFLSDTSENQKDIVKFINRCKEIEDKDGCIKQSLFETKINQNYRFVSGPFSDQIFKIIKLHKNKIQILLSGIKTTLNKEKLQYLPA
jgi:hypothetical protein